jgi:hypothetical protein
MTDGSDEIHVNEKVYRHSRHYRAKPLDEREVTNAQIEYVLLNPFHQEEQGPRRTIYWRYVPELKAYLKVVEDRLPTGELQILTAYLETKTPLNWENYE